MDVIAILRSRCPSVFHIVNDLEAETLHRQPARCGLVPKHGWEDTYPVSMLNIHNTCIRCYKLYTAQKENSND